MFFGRLFRQGNTCRITIPLQMRHAIQLRPNDMVAITHPRPGVLEVRNASLEYALIIKKESP